MIIRYLDILDYLGWMKSAADIWCSFGIRDVASKGPSQQRDSSGMADNWHARGVEIPAALFGVSRSPRMEGIHLCASSWAPAFTEPSRAAWVLQSRMSIQGENVRTITARHRTTRNLIWEAKTYPKPRKTDEKTSKNTHHPLKSGVPPSVTPSLWLRCLE